MVEGAELLSHGPGVGGTDRIGLRGPRGEGQPSVAEVVEQVFDAGVRVFDLAPGVIERISDTVTPQPVVAVVGFIPAALEDLEDASWSWSASMCVIRATPAP